MSLSAFLVDGCGCESSILAAAQIAIQKKIFFLQFNQHGKYVFFLF